MLLTQSEKKKIALTVIILIIVTVTFFADFSLRAVLLAYVIGVVAFIALVEIYIFFTYVSDRFRSFSYVTLYIRGVPQGRRTYVDVDGKFIYRYRGELNGASVKFLSGLRDITVRSDTLSATVNADATNHLTIRIDVRDYAIDIITEYREPTWTKEETEARQRSYKRVNVFLFLMMNFFALFAVLRILGASGIL